MATKKTTFKESSRMFNPPKGYKKDTSNSPDPKKLKEYYKKKRSN